jgi:hypothetical protein
MGFLSCSMKSTECAFERASTRSVVENDQNPTIDGRRNEITKFRACLDNHKRKVRGDDRTNNIEHLRSLWSLASITGFRASRFAEASERLRRYSIQFPVTHPRYVTPSDRACWWLAKTTYNLPCARNSVIQLQLVSLKWISPSAQYFFDHPSATRCADRHTRVAIIFLQRRIWTIHFLSLSSDSRVGQGYSIKAGIQGVLFRTRI